MQTIDQNLITRGEELWRTSHDVEKLLHFLRSNGVSKLESVKAARLICQISLGDAKQMVFGSSVWQDTAEATEALHDQVIAALESVEKN